MLSFSKRKSLSRNRIFIMILVSAGLFSLVLPVMAQVSLAPLNPDFVEYFQKFQISGVQAITVEGYPLGFIPPPLDLSHLTGQPIFQAHELVAAPSSYDLRTVGKITPVRDQGNCGSCWTFATYGSLESNLLPSETWDFSENNLKNTHGFDPGSCGGGNGLMSTAYLGRWSGPANETDDPYNPSSNISPSGLMVRKHVQEVLIIPGRTSASDNDNIKQAIMTYGALMTSMYFDPACPSCSSFDSAYNTYYYSGTANVNHGVVIVGWDDSFDKNKFATVPPGNGAFIIKNSWGTGWGENGYFYISYYDTQTGKYNYMFNGAEPATDYSGIYQYDRLGWEAAMGHGTTTAWGANIFTASATEVLSAVSFYTASPNSSFQIYVYSDVTSGPTSGSLSSSKTGTIEIPGYHTIPLDPLVYLGPGQTFSVVIRLTTPGYKYPIPVEIPISGYSSQATANPGESFVSSNGSSWTDITSISGCAECNVCLKAFSIPPEPNLTPYQPPGWSDKIVVINKTGCTSTACTDSSRLYITDTLYIDWAVINNGTAATSATFYTQLYVDGVAKSSWYNNPPLNFSNSNWVYLLDYSIGALSAGTHTIKIVADSTGVIDESNEGDNEYTKTITVRNPAIILQSPSDSVNFSACSLYSLPTFSWTTSETFEGYQIQFSLNTSFSSPFNVKTSGAQITMTSAKWKKVLVMPGVIGGTVYWRVVGTRTDKTTFITQAFSIIVDGAQSAGDLIISSTGKTSLPQLSWQNNCNIKFKVWFGSDDSFSKKSGYLFSNQDPNGSFLKTLTTGQWKAIRKLVGDTSGSTIYWHVESWDKLKRYSVTGNMSFVLAD